MMNKQVFFKKKKSCPFSGEDGMKIDYKDVKLLSRYISEKAKSSRAVSLRSLPKTKRTGPRHQTRPLCRSASVCRQLRRNEMEVILLEHVNKLGKMGDKVNVKNGYARNYLLPTKKALRATAENLAFYEKQKLNWKLTTKLCSKTLPNSLKNCRASKSC